MKQNLLFAIAASLCLAGIAFGQATQSKVGIIHIENALISTGEGKKALEELNTNVYEPLRKRLERMQEEITALQTELSKGSNTMGEERRRDLARQIDEKNRTLSRATEDAEMEVQQEQAKMFESMGQKLMAIITKHATENGYTLILNVADPQTPVLFAANGYDITQAVIKLYDEQNPSTAAAAAPATPEP